MKDQESSVAHARPVTSAEIRAVAMGDFCLGSVDMVAMERLVSCYLGDARCDHGNGSRPKDAVLGLTFI